MSAVKPSVGAVTEALQAAHLQRNGYALNRLIAREYTEAILALLPGRTEVEVKAEALEEAATSLEGGLGVEGTPGTLYEYRAWLRARADRIERMIGE